MKYINLVFLLMLTGCVRIFNFTHYPVSNVEPQTKPLVCEVDFSGLEQEGALPDIPDKDNEIITVLSHDILRLRRVIVSRTVIIDRIKTQLMQCGVRLKDDTKN